MQSVWCLSKAIPGQKLSRSLGINTNMIGHWVRDHQDDDGQALRGNGKLTPEQEDNRKLKAQVRRLQMERDIL